MTSLKLLVTHPVCLFKWATTEPVCTFCHCTRIFVDHLQHAHLWHMHCLLFVNAIYFHLKSLKIRKINTESFLMYSHFYLNLFSSSFQPDLLNFKKGWMMKLDEDEEVNSEKKIQISVVLRKVSTVMELFGCPLLPSSGRNTGLFCQ